ncbi:MAG: hypothetical protein IJX87_00965 [Clostridia bacterium]|nr:hypothetical protein [Clostridia bacterium]
MLQWKNNRVVFADNRFLNAVMVDDVCVSYTLKTEDITKQKKVECTPYVSRKEYFDERGYAPKTKTCLTVKEERGGVELSIETDSDELSEFGLYLPFNFISKLNGGDWRDQFLFNSPYASKDNRYVYSYFSAINGRNVMMIANSPVDGWKMDYSPYVGGHFFDNFKLLANFDRAYGTNSARKGLKLWLFEVANFTEGLKKAAEVFGVPVAYYEKNAGKLGEEMEIFVIGEADAVIGNGKTYPVKNGKTTVTLDVLGDNIFTPVCNGKEGLDCTMYAFTSLKELYKASMDTVCEEDLRATDGNLCEHQCWASAMLRYMLKYGGNAEYEGKLKGLLNIITETDEEKAKIYHDITIFNRPQENGLPAWHIYGSRRIQEQFFGITILLDAYQYFGEELYLQYAVHALDTLIEHYQTEGGGFVTAHGGEGNDYSTVCCLMIPIVDMANYFKDKNPALAEKYRVSAAKLAYHLNARGYSFPTETEYTEEAGEEHEDGSISCTALALLYYSANIERNQTYIDTALEILQIHEAWVVKTPIAQMYRSSLRWWETRWEGDKDGPALCMGHAWSIWRAEADYWAYVATGDEAWLQKATCGFYGNFAKINQKGESYSIYQADYITGGGFLPGVVTKYEIVPKYPRQTDSGLSRYVWIRAADTILR